MKKTAVKTKGEITREPLLRLVKRDTVPISRAILVRAAAIALALLVCGVFFVTVTDSSIIDIYSAMISGTIRNSITVNAFLKEASMLLLIAIGLAPAFKMSFWNVGGQGQVLAGGMAAAMWLFYLGNKLPNAVLLPLMIVSAAIGGGIWALIPAVFRVKFTTNETLFTLMMNYIAIQLIKYLRITWSPIHALGMIQRKSGSLPALFGNVNGWIYVIAAVAVVLMYVYMNKTKHGYEISVVGEAPNTARYAGISEFKVIIRTAFISGAICGIAGFLYVSAIDHTISETMSGGYGFTAVIVAWLAKFNPIFMTLISMLISFVRSGSSEIVSRNTTTLDSSIANINIGIFLFFMLGCEFFLNYKVVFRGRKEAVK